MLSSRLVAVLLFLGVVSSMFSCRPANSPEGMECSDPKIDKKVERLLVGESERVSQPLGTTNPYFTNPYLSTLEEAKAFLANPTEPLIGFAYDANAHPTVQERVDAFLAKTDFTKEKLTFTVANGQGGEGFVGEIETPGHVTFVFHTCSQMGGTPPPSFAFTAIYRIPKDAVASQDNCGSCPQVECCPP
ncbi:MAG: hypothetical protein ACRELY_09460 [Polyangiaceae bacterium]